VKIEKKEKKKTVGDESVEVMTVDVQVTK